MHVRLPVCFVVMDEHTKQRIAKQHVMADKLLGLDAVPCDLSKAVVSTLMQGGVGAARSVIGQGGAVMGTHGVGDGMADMTRGGVKAPPLPNVSRSQPVQRNTRVVTELKAVEPLVCENLNVDEKVIQLRVMYEDEVKECKKCPLGNGRINAVFGEGKANADVMFVGEGPGYHEDVQGRPFVGRSGELLDKQIAAMGLTRDEIYIANVVKCRPPNNRTPVITEVEACRHYLQRQIAIIQPKVIITLGGPAAKLLLNTKEGITRLRGMWHEYHGVKPAIPVMPTFHPAYLLRQYTRDNRIKVWSDLKEAMTKVM